MSYPIKPLYDRVFVKKDDEQSLSALDVPQSIKGRAKTGTVVACGDGLLSPHLGTYLPMKVKVGDRVFVHEFSGQQLRYKDYEIVYIFQENEIIGVIND